MGIVEAIPGKAGRIVVGTAASERALGENIGGEATAIVGNWFLAPAGGSNRTFAKAARLSR
jgi:hypothetical protein